MFQLAQLLDTVRVPPALFDHHSTTPASAVTLAINAKYANRVLPDVGLCIALFDILECSEARIRSGDGCAYHDTLFRLVIFRPFLGEVLVGTIKSSDTSGIKVSLGFFDDIFIPAHNIPTPCAFDHKEQAWFWAFDSPEGDDPWQSDAASQRLYLDRNNPVRFAVERETFDESEPDPKARNVGVGVGSAVVATGGSAAGGGGGAVGGGGTGAAGPGGPAAVGSSSAAATSGGALSSTHHQSLSLANAASAAIIPGATAETSGAQKRPPYRIEATIAAQGLGIPSWWQSDEAAEATQNDMVDDGLAEDQEGTEMNGEPVEGEP